MGRTIIAIVLALAMVAGYRVYEAQAQEAREQSKLNSEGLEAESKDLDNQIVALSAKIEEVVKRYNLMTTKDIRILPFQVTYDLTSDSIEIKRYYLVKDDMLNKVTILKEKTMRIFSSGSAVSRIESEVTEKDYNSGTSTTVKIIDPSPTTAGTDDIVLTHIVNKRVVVDGKKLTEVKNSLAFPVRNELKRDFYVPHLSYFYSVILNIAETYNKGLKDSDTAISEFLKRSVRY
jgi:hypothetical protein